MALRVVWYTASRSRLHGVNTNDQVAYEDRAASPAIPQRSEMFSENAITHTPAAGFEVAGRFYQVSVGFVTAMRVMMPAKSSEAVGLSRAPSPQRGAAPNMGLTIRSDPGAKIGASSLPRMRVTGISSYAGLG
ncbi:hypothetical protein [Paenarthrobacter nitroguajacolicus]|uniref:hypothetical protein n=1 Tax=Paenarthrobacter nitroguajacolicus TaxID=211146 RepID=UPI00342D435F